MQDTGDVLYRVSGLTMLMSGLFNSMISFIWVGTLIWFCVGIFWVVPLLMAVTQIVLGIVMIATGRQFAPLAFAPLLGLFTSMFNMNFFGMVLDVLSVGIGIGGFAIANQRALEDRDF